MLSYENILRSRPDVDSSRIFVFGRSLGGAVAVDLCSKNRERVACLILENTFTRYYYIQNHLKHICGGLLVSSKARDYYYFQ